MNSPPPAHCATQHEVSNELSDRRKEDEGVEVAKEEGGERIVDIGEREERDSREQAHAALAESCDRGETANVPLALPPLAQQLHLLTGSWEEFDSTNHLKGCKWAPDGTCLLVCSSDSKLRLYNLPPELYSGPVDTQLPEMKPVLTLPMGEVVYDYCWYPLMSSWEPDTACFASSCKDHPVQLWDAFNLQKRASYTPYNHLDELATPYSLSFSLDGQELYCGFNKCVRVFTTCRPGRECQLVPIHEKKWGGQSGIVSCIAMHPTQPETYAVGSYSCQVGLYSRHIQGPLFLLTGVGGGVTHMLFSSDGNLLFTGYRKSSVLQVWDLRNPGDLLLQVDREVNTNQRIYFDLYRCEFLVSGSTSGHVHGWDMRTMDSATPLSPHLLHCAHSDAVTGCSVHPSLPFLATASGQRHFSLPSASSDSEEDAQPDNSLKLWSLASHTPASPSLTDC